MQSFSNKGQGETLTLAYAFTNRLPSGVIIASATISAAVAPSSSVPDANPSAILNGSPQINEVATVITVPFGPKVTIAPGQAMLQSVIGGIVGCTYVLTFTATLSDGEIFVAQPLITVTEFVPTP